MNNAGWREPSQIIPDDNLKEANCGAWSGLTKIEVERKFPGQIDQRKNSHWTYRFPEGESYADLSDRAAVWWQKHKETERVIIVITHEMMSRCIRGQYWKLDPANTLQLNHQNNHVFILNNRKITEHQLPN